MDNPNEPPNNVQRLRKIMILGTCTAALTKYLSNQMGEKELLDVLRAAKERVNKM